MGHLGYRGRDKGEPGAQSDRMSTRQMVNRPRFGTEMRTTGVDKAMHGTWIAEGAESQSSNGRTTQSVDKANGAPKAHRMGARHRVSTRQIR
ncbi:hypothetical protein KI387_026592, partial [Taxus chinensis]